VGVRRCSAGTWNQKYGADTTTEETKVEFLKVRPKHKVQVGGATYAGKHLANQLNNNEQLIESEITTGDVPGEFVVICISCAEYLWASLAKR
jgi:hypothetical protein